MDVQLLNDSGATNAHKATRRSNRRKPKARLPYEVTPTLPALAPSGYQPPLIVQGVVISRSEQQDGIIGDAQTIQHGASLTQSLQSTSFNQYTKHMVVNHHMDRSAYGRTKSDGWVPGDSRSTGNGDDEGSINVWSHGCCWIQCVRTQELGITESFGEFREIVGPGVHCVAWPFNSISGRLSLRIQQLDVACEAKTKDNVFVQIMLTVFFRVIVPRAYDAYYRLSDPLAQIRSYVLDVVRSTVPRLSLDEAFTSTSDITDAVFCRLHQVMKEFGYEIVRTLITELRPNIRVKASMNAVKAARSLKEAMSNRAELEKVKILRKAEAHAEELYLSGLGTAKARKALAQGWSNCVQEWPTGNFTEKEVMDLLLQVQYMDTLTAVGPNSFVLPIGGTKEMLET